MAQLQNSSITGSLIVSGSIRALTPTSSSYLCVGILTSDYSVSPEEDVVINFVAQIDPNSWWDGPKFTPTIPGYYNINFGAWFENIGVSGNQVNIQVRKSGTAQMISQVPSNNVVSQSLFCSKIIYMNGDTDYLDFTAWHPGSTAKLLLRGTADGSGTWFSANFLGI